jgi:hypothetical protein
MTRVLVLAGCGCLALMVLTHVAEALALFPGMGWGLPNSPGHYLDLFSAISGVVLLLAAGALRLLPYTKHQPFECHAGRPYYGPNKRSRGWTKKPGS